MSIGGLDIGTTGCKLTVYDEEGNYLCNAYREYNVARKSGEHEIDANVVWQSVKEVIIETTSKVSDLTAFGVTSFGESFVMLDEKDNIILPSMLYTDTRGENECRELDSQRIVAVAGVKPHSMYSLPKIMWIKKNLPHIYEKAKRILLFEDFIVYMLTGIAQIDYSLASRTMAFNIREKCWDGCIFENAGIEISKMSKPVMPGTVAGKVRSGISKELGLNKDTIIVSGCHDQVAATVGAGVFNTGMAIDGTGTVECITPVFENIPDHLDLYNGGYAVLPYVLPGKYVCYAFSFTGGAVLKWFRDNLCKYEATISKNVYSALDNKIPNNPTGILVLPHFAGAATPYMDSNSKAAIIGLTLETTEHDIYKALMEGVTYEILTNIERLEEVGIKLDILCATGGGANSEKWLQMKADILNRPIMALDAKEAGTTGTVMLTGVATNVFKSLEIAKNALVKEKKMYYPRDDIKKEYAKIYKRYKNVYNAVRPLI